MEFLLQLQAILGVLALIFVYNVLMVRIRFKNTNKRKEAPELSGALPLIGHLHMLGGRKPLARTFAAMADKCGPVFTLRVGVHRTLVVGDLEMIKECFTTNDKVFATRPSSMAGKYLAYDYAAFGLSPYGTYWREIRKIATLELLSNRRIEMLKHIRSRVLDTSVDELYGIWDKNHRPRPVEVEMKQWFGDLTFNTIVAMVAGKRFYGTTGLIDHDDAQRFKSAMHELIFLAGVFVPSDALPFLEWIDIKGYTRAMKRVAKEVDSILESWLEEHRRKRLSGFAEGEKDGMDVMLSILEDGHIADYDPSTVIKATSQTLIMAGSDSTAATLTWALSLLLNNPSVLKKAQIELDTHVGTARKVDESDIKNLEFLQAIIKETLRLYPPAPLSVPHEAMEDCQVGGFHVSAGTRLMVNIWKLQRDPSVWSDPCEFRPERFLTSHVDVDAKGQHFEFIPFGAGRRSCPGYALAFQILHLTLSRLIQGFELEAPSTGPVDMIEGLGLALPRATPLQVLLTPRLPSHLYRL